MKLLLINKNPVVSRMMQMSVPKAGFEIEECENVYDLPQGKYEVVILDDEMYDESFLQSIKENIQYDKIGLITSAKKADIAEFDFVLSKPFLPTDLVELLRRLKEELEAEQVQLKEQESEEANEKSDQEVAQEANKEPIVEIEEEPEESPFVDEPLEKAGVLDEGEIQEVSALLEDEEPKQESTSVNSQDSTNSQDDEEPVKEESEPRPEEILTEPPEESLEPPIAKVQEEPQPEEPKEENIVQEDIPQKDISQKDIPQEASSLEEKTMDSMPMPKEDASTALAANGLEEMKQQIQKLDVNALRSILDGMQLEITIKISYPDKKDV